MCLVLRPLDIRERLGNASAAAVARDEAGLELAESWLANVSARELLRIDGFARQYRYDGPMLGKAQNWTRGVLNGSLTAAALASMHRDGFLRERAVRVLCGSETPLSDRMLAIRAAYHVDEVRRPASEAILVRTDPDQCVRVMAVLQRFEARSRGAEVRTVYLGAMESRHGEQRAWELLRGSTDRDLRRAAHGHSLERGLLGVDDAVAQLPRERDQVVRRMLASVIAERAEPAVIRSVLLHARSAESRVLGLVKLDAPQLDPNDVEGLLVDSSVLVRFWARLRWREMGNDPVECYRRIADSDEKPARRARAYTGLTECDVSIDRSEVRDLVHSSELPLQKVGLRLLVDKATSEDVSDLLSIVSGEHSRLARLASDVLASNLGIWSVADLAVLKAAEDPILRRRGWWLHRNRRGWEAVIADLEILQDPVRHLSLLGRQPHAPMYFQPDERQREHIAELLGPSVLSRDEKLDIALAAGLRDLMIKLRETSKYPATEPEEGQPEPKPSWWQRLRDRN